MTDTPKRIAGPIALTTGAVTVYTVPGATSTVIRTIQVTNTTGSAVTFNLSIGADAAATRLFSGKSVAANDVFSWAGNIPMVAAETIQGLASATGLTLTIGGVETIDSIPVVLANQVPTLDELVVSPVINPTGGTFVPPISSGLLVCEFPLKVAAFSLAFWGTGVTASDTNYYTFDLRKYLNATSSFVVIASKTTKVTGGAAINQRQDWNFDATAFDAANQLCVKGDIVAIAITPTGSPASISGAAGGTLATLRYVPT